MRILTAKSFHLFIMASLISIMLQVPFQKTKAGMTGEELIGVGVRCVAALWFLSASWRISEVKRIAADAKVKAEAEVGRISLAYSTRPDSLDIHIKLAEIGKEKQGKRFINHFSIFVLK